MTKKRDNPVQEVAGNLSTTSSWLRVNNRSFDSNHSDDVWVEIDIDASVSPLYFHICLSLDNTKHFVNSLETNEFKQQQVISFIRSRASFCFKLALSSS